MAALTGPNVVYPFQAHASLLTTTAQYLVCDLRGSAYQVGVASTTAGVVIGINQTYFTSGASAVAQVVTGGFSKAIAAGSITCGAPLMVSGAGLVAELTYTSYTTATTGYIVGYACETGTAANQVIGIFVRPGITLGKE